MKLVTNSAPFICDIYVYIFVNGKILLIEKSLPFEIMNRQ